MTNIFATVFREKNKNFMPLKKNALISIVILSLVQVSTNKKNNLPQTSFLACLSLLSTTSKSPLLPTFSLYLFTNSPMASGSPTGGCLPLKPSELGGPFQNPDAYLSITPARLS